MEARFMVFIWSLETNEHCPLNKLLVLYLTLQRETFQHVDSFCSADEPKLCETHLVVVMFTLTP
jgi:hypothetical protein